METIQCGALLFDLDGVLVDSTPAVTRVWKAWAFEHGIDGEQLVRVAHGRTNLSTIRELLPNGDYEAEARKVEQREIEDVDGLIPLPGALELLKILPMNRWAVVTSCSRPLAEARIRAAGLLLSKHFITSNEIVRSKPDPEAYLLGAKSVGLAATDCVVIEDAPAGIRSGKAAGARYNKDEDFVFASPTLNGRQPLWGQNMNANFVKPAAIKLGLVTEGERFGWHRFRHSLSTWANETTKDITVSQTMLRHAKPDTTAIYTHGNFDKALDAQRVYMDQLLRMKPASESTQ